MTEVNSLIRKSVGALDDYVLADSLFVGFDAVEFFCDSLKSGGLKGEGVNGLNFCDFAWRKVLDEFPRASFYPLGMILERGFKKTMIVLLGGEGLSGSLRVSGGRVFDRVRKRVEKEGVDFVLRTFLCEYFFELCINESRRYWDKEEFDLGYWYNFSREGDFVSLKVERSLRERLRKRCVSKAYSFFSFVEGRDVGKVRCGFREVFGVELKRGRRASRGVVNVVFGDVSLKSLRRDFAVGRDVLRLRLGREVLVSFDSLGEYFGGEVHSLIKDLVEIGSAVYMSDLYVSRGRDLGRRVGLVVPVRHLGFWRRVREDLNRLVSFLGRDDFSINFIKHKEKADRVKRFSVKDSRRCVCLFSGGLDTLSGAVDVLKKGFRPVFLSHYSSTLLCGKQKGLLSRLEDVFGEGAFEHLSVRVGKGKGLGSPCSSVMIQYLRSFLFLCLASCVALEKGISKVFVLENGPVSLNPLFSEAKINTQTTHPHFLAMFREFVLKAFGVELEISDPFIYSTKGEVVSLLRPKKLRGLVGETVSCWNWSRVPIRAKQKGILHFNGRHDGVCVPCIIRRCSVCRAGLCDDDSDYLFDVFRGFDDLKRIDKGVVADLVRGALNVRRLDSFELLYRFCDLAVWEKGINSFEIVDMYKRHCGEILGCLRSKGSRRVLKRFGV